MDVHGAPAVSLGVPLGLKSPRLAHRGHDARDELVVEERLVHGGEVVRRPWHHGELRRLHPELLYELVDVLDDPVAGWPPLGAALDVLGTEGLHDLLHDLRHDRGDLGEGVARRAVWLLRIIRPLLVLHPGCPRDPPEVLLLGLPRAVEVRKAVVVEEVASVIEGLEHGEHLLRRPRLRHEGARGGEAVVEACPVVAAAGGEQPVRSTIFWAEDEGILGGHHLLPEAVVAVRRGCGGDGGLRDLGLGGGQHSLHPPLQGHPIGYVVLLDFHLVIDVAL